jgi:WD40 repeat protein
MAPSGSYITGELFLWDVETSQVIHRLVGHNNVAQGYFSPDGQTIISGSNDSTIRFWDVETGEEVRRINTLSGPIWDICLSPDGRYPV